MLRKEGEINTKPCPHCGGKGIVSRKSKSGEDTPTSCPVCDGYGFVIAIAPLALKNPLK